MKLFFWMCLTYDLVISLMLLMFRLKIYTTPGIAQQTDGNIISNWLPFSGTIVLVIAARLLYKIQWQKAVAFIVVLPLIGFISSW